MTFDPLKVEEFLRIFEDNAEKIRNFPGCEHLELLHSCEFPNILFTYSLWETPENLDEYRRSDLFVKVWVQTKKLFTAPAEAWSLNKKWSSADNLTKNVEN